MTIWCTRRGHRLDPAHGHQQSLDVCLAGCRLRDRCAAYRALDPDEIRKADHRLIDSGRPIGLPLLEVASHG